MERKKSTKVKLESNSPLYFTMGLVLGLSTILVAFEWSSSSRTLGNKYLRDSSGPIVEDVLVTIREPEPPKPQIEEPKLISPDVLILTDDVIDQADIVSLEDTPDALPPAAVYVPKPPVTNTEEAVFDFAEIQPSFKGGQSAMMQFLSENIRYPSIAIEQEQAGRVICSFVVEKDGSITDIHVLRGVSPSLDKEAIRVIESMPGWTPGLQNGVPVRVKLTLPIIFRLMKQ